MIRVFICGSLFWLFLFRAVLAAAGGRFVVRTLQTYHWLQNFPFMEVALTIQSNSQRSGQPVEVLKNHQHKEQQQVSFEN